MEESGNDREEKWNDIYIYSVTDVIQEKKNLVNDDYQKI